MRLNFRSGVRSQFLKRCDIYFIDFFFCFHSSRVPLLLCKQKTELVFGRTAARDDSALRVGGFRRGKTNSFLEVFVGRIDYISIMYRHCDINKTKRETAHHMRVANWTQFTTQCVFLREYILSNLNK